MYDETSTAAAVHMLERARWAARAYATYTAADVSRIVTAVADAAHAKAGYYAEWAVRETGFGVAEHKRRKNEACSRGIADTYAVQDFVTPTVDAHRKVVEIPRPAGVVLALAPSTNPIATVYFKILLALMTRNAIVVSPHPMAKECSADAAETLARAAADAGAPDGVVQCVAEPTIPLIEALMSDERTNVILATGGTGVVRAAYASGNPALGVGPGNVPVFVDATADLKATAQRLVESKAFDNSVLCTNESVLIVEDSVADALSRELERDGAAVLDQAAAAQLSAYMFPEGRLKVKVIGKDAAWIAQQAGIRVGPRTKVLVAPFDVAVPEEPMTREKLSPVLGMIRVRNVSEGIATARAIVRIAGAGHSAAIHSADAATIMQFGAEVPVLRVSVNVGNSTGSAGLDTNLAPTMTIGTGFAGRSALGENLEPKHLVNWTRLAYNADATVPMPAFPATPRYPERSGPTPPYPRASNDPGITTGSGQRVAGPIATQIVRSPGHTDVASDERFRAEVRRMVLEELSQLIKE